MRMSGNGRARTGPTAVVKRPVSYATTIRRVLSKVPQIDAVFHLKDDASVVHVFSVVREFQSKLYSMLLPKEDAIEKKFPQVIFEFHVRAHQGREPAQAVPFDAEAVFTR